MRNINHHARTGLVVMLGSLCLLFATNHSSAQTFSSGSTGALGAFNPATDTVVPLPPDGVLNYTTVTIPAGVTVTFQRNAANTPATLLATGDVTVNGILSVNGNQGTGDGSSTAVPLGGLGGPGGFNGGNGNLRGGPGPTQGQGPGGGAIGAAGSYGAPSTFVTLIPLFGGSGGGGGNPFGTLPSTSAGGGGGGAIVIASSSRITVAAGGTVSANGGASGPRNFFNNNCGFAGSGGAVRLVAPQIAGAGSLQASGGASGVSAQPPCGGSSGAVGRIRLEAFSLTFGGSISPTASQSLTPGPVTAASSPGLAALPRLTISSVGSVGVPVAPGGSYTAADVSMPQGTTNPVRVIIQAANTPVPTAMTLRLLPQSGNGTTISIPVASHAGTFASSSAMADVTFPVGTVSVVQAWATMTLAGQIASLFPLIDGEPVEQVMVASLDGKSSSLSLVTKSGKEKRLDQFDPADQLKVAQAWQIMREVR